MNHDNKRISPLLSLRIDASGVDELGRWRRRGGDETGDDAALVVLARVAALRLCAGGDRGGSRRCLGPTGVVFLPRVLSELFLDQAVRKVAETDHALGRRLEEWKSSKAAEYTLLEPANILNFSSTFMSSIHPSLRKARLEGVLLLSDDAHSPADLVLFDLTQFSHQEIQAVLDETNGGTIQNTMHGEFLLKVILVSDVVDVQQSQSTANSSLSTDAVTDHALQSFDMPTCPVCIHRIDPVRLGLLKPHLSQLCSNFCPPPHILHNGEMLHNACSKQQLLSPWPDPSRCACCRCIEEFWRRGPLEGSATSVSAQSTLELADMFCYKCSMQETLWVCMTCGFVGCGRYSNKHAAEHFHETNHPYSLELATLRVWDYVESEYVHRTDLLECPSSPPLMHPLRLLASPPRSALEVSTAGPSVKWDVGYATGRGHNQATEKTPKKASMIGEEYEALLQSALEDQAQHYEGEITRLRATLAAETVDASQLTETERKEMEVLQKDICFLRSEIDSMSREVLSIQAQEAGHRAISQRLLREQQVAQDLITKVKEEEARERERGRQQIDDLEQQIADLTANQRMRHTFAHDEELANAQLFGAQNTPNINTSDKKVWKKSKRLSRR